MRSRWRSGRVRGVRFERSFLVHAPVEAVAAFHGRPDALAMLTPAPLQVLGEAAPMREGATMRFRLWVGPFPVAWRARYEHVRDDGFDDVMVEGPFRAWRHSHRWRAVDGGTLVTDTIVAELGGAASRLVWAGMAPAFAYRAWRTRRALQER